MSRHPVNQATHDARSFGERTADTFTRAFGTWRYIIIQTLIIVAWMTLNVIALIHHWDAYPFILLNLGFSAQASYAAPLILMAQNRSAAVDRLTLEHDAQLNETELMILQELQKLTREVHEITTKAAA